MQKQISDADREKKEKNDKLKNLIEKKRQEVLQKYNTDIQNHLKKLNEAGLTQEQKTQIETQIATVKAKIREMMSTKDKEKQ